MRFSLSHEFDVEFDVLERAVLSPDLPARLFALLGPRIESIQTIEFDRGPESRRVLRYQAAALLPRLGTLVGASVVTPDMLAWTEVFVYTTAAHTAAWEVKPLEAYRRHFGARGVYRLEPLASGGTRRVVEGDLNVRVRLVGRMIERIALAEVKKTYDAEAVALGGLAQP